jgi:hypothetical protein
LNSVCCRSASPFPGSPPIRQSLPGRRKVDSFPKIGFLASLAAPLAETKISLFAVSTFDTDYLFVASETLAAAIAAL